MGAAIDLSAREDRKPLLVRIDLIAAISWGAFILILAVYWVHQVLRGDEFHRQAENNRQRSIPVTAPRGFIVDRNGVPLAENEPSFSLLLYRREASDVESSLQFVSSVTGTLLEDLRRRILRSGDGRDYLPVILEENLSVDEAAAIEAHALEHPEFVIQISERRIYKGGPIAAHLLGHLGEANPDQVQARNGRVRPGEWIGQKGVEAVYQDLLAGVSGARTFIIDSFGREVAELDRQEPLSGNTLILTIDSRLQKIAEAYFEGRVGSAVALDPKSGEILAFVSAPAYDPNLFAQRVSKDDWDAILNNEDKPLNNRLLQNVYSPGSVWKAFVAYAILMHGISPSERIPCGGGATFYGRFFRCHSHHSTVDLPTALQVSCDTYFYQMGRRLGIDVLAETADLFGFGRPTGIDAGGEKSGLVPSPKWSLAVRKHPWYPGETISVSIGQGPLLVSPLQVARALSALANSDGALPTPHVFHMAENVRTRERFLYRPPVKEQVPFDPGVREAIVEGLFRVVSRPGGTAYAVHVPGLDMCGKTGTVQVVGQKDPKKMGHLPEKLQDHAWFAGFAPKDDPRVVVVVFVENGGHGSKAAAPLAAKLMKAYLRGFPETEETHVSVTAQTEEAAPPAGSTEE
ncbi:MAG: Peptidoglycan D,D-transpeptidase MrdA [Thermoanaerobaculia bacterium]|nr:Peptidoglycan D,D-transpeptidase MrdA [Thermoanaerobaculia bacterium]